MRKSFAIILVIGICFLVIAATAARAEHSSSTSYDLWYLPNSGSAVDMNSSGNHVQDVKGSFLGHSSASGYDLWIGIGALAGVTGTTTGEPIEPVGDTGIIQQTIIVRNSDGNTATPDPIYLYWSYKTGFEGTPVHIWEYRGADANFNENTSSWSKLNTIPITANSFDTTRKSGDGQNAYYRVVPSTVAQSQIMDLAQNTRVAAKVDVVLTGGGIANYTLLAPPLYGLPLGQTFAGQATANIIVWKQSGSGVTPVEWQYTTQAFAFDDIAMEPSKGYWVENDGSTAVTMSFVGTLETGNSKTIQQTHLTGNPLPIALDGVLIGGVTGDIVWVQSGSGLTPKEKRTTGWDAFTLNNAQGMWYWHAGNRFMNILLFGAAGEKVKIIEGTL